MNKTLKMMGFTKWNRKILNIFWTVVPILLIVSTLNLFITSTDKDFYFKFHIIYPALSLITTMLLLEILIHYTKKYEEYFIIIGIINLSSIIIYWNPENTVLISMLVLPLFISAFYFDKKLSFVAFLLSLLAYFIIYSVNDDFSDSNSFISILSFMFLLIGSFILTSGVMFRGIEIIEYLEKTIESQQELMAKKAIVEQESKIDGLTNLYNHKAFQQYFDIIMSQTEQYDIKLQLALIDIDNFKKVNDTYGHQAGDIVLKEISKMIQENVTPNEIVARYGGEELAILFTDRSKESSIDIVENIRNKISLINFKELNNNSITISVGLHEYEQTETKKEMFEKTDIALYEAKTSGKNKVVVQ